MNQGRSTFLHVVDAFTTIHFAGNPAAVCLLDAPADETWMQQVAREMNLAETAFLHPIEGGWALRWFTPAVEVKLCGHATLASAFVLWQTGVHRGETARFHTLSGWLSCTRGDNGWSDMDFPAEPANPCPVPAGLAEALGYEVLASADGGMDLLAEVPDEATLRRLNALARWPVRGIIATCRGESPGHDFVSRFFAPAAGVNEDPVTGSAHCKLGPWWQPRLGKSEFTAFQASARGGLVKVRVQGDRVLLSGQAVMMSRVELFSNGARAAGQLRSLQ